MGKNEDLNGCRASIEGTSRAQRKTLRVAASYSKKSTARSIHTQLRLEKAEKPINNNSIKNNTYAEDNFDKEKKFIVIDKDTEDKILLNHILCRILEIGVVEKIATRLIEHFGDFQSIFYASERNILEVEGVTAEIYANIRLIFELVERLSRTRVLNCDLLESWSDFISYCRVTMANQKIEQFRVFFLDSRNALIKDETQSSGTIDHVHFYAREVVKRALELSASTVILVHNHPSGDPTPSLQDIKATQQICAACEIVDIKVHDHVIIGSSGDFSLWEHGLINRTTHPNFG